MRIISGSKKGKKLILPDPKITRPLKDNVKENIFNILLHTRDFKINFEGDIVIDFFSGSGSFGIECLSRGAKFVIFNETNSQSRNTLFRNLSNNFNKSMFEIKNNNFFNIDVLSLIRKVKPKLVFFDPPYAMEDIEKVFKIINSIDTVNTIIILHIEKKINFDFINFRKKLQRIYGISKIIFLKK